MDIESYDKFKQYRERLRVIYEQAKDGEYSDSGSDILELSYLCLNTLVHRFDLMRNPAFISSMELYESAKRGNTKDFPRAIFELSDFLVERINEMFDGMN